MKYIVQYKMHGSEIPYFIEDPGHFVVDGKMIGVTKDSSSCYIPTLVSDGGELVSYTYSELIDYVKAIDSELSTEDKEALAISWLNERGFSE